MSGDVATIDLPYIEKNKSRHKKMRYYFRIDGVRIARLPDDPDTEEFAVAYWRERKAYEARAGQPEPDVDAMAGPPRPNTFRWLASKYLASDAFAGLDPSTQAKRRAIIDAMLLEPVLPDAPALFASMPLSELDTENLQVLRDRKKDTPFAADERLKVLCQIFDTTQIGKDGKPAPIVKVNYARMVRRFRVKTDGHHTIRDDEIAKFIAHHKPDSKATLAIVLLMYTGLRVSDLCVIGPQHRRGDKHVLRLFKGRNRNPVTLTIPVHPVLDKVLSQHKITGMNYLMTEYGKPYSVKGLGNRVSDWFTQAGLEHCTAHTVRKGLATSLAENDATDSMLDGFFGWQDGKTSKIYTRQKQQAKLAWAAISKIEWGEIGNVLPHPDEGVAVPGDGARKKAS